MTNEEIAEIMVAVGKLTSTVERVDCVSEIEFKNYYLDLAQRYGSELDKILEKHNFDKTAVLKLFGKGMVKARKDDYLNHH